MTEDKIFQLQRAQRIGIKTETIEARLEVGKQKAVFDTWGAELDSATIIGAVCYLPTGVEKSLTGATLLTKAQAGAGVFHVSHSNKSTLDVPLRLLQTESKNLVYVPIEAIKGIENKQTYIMFSEVAAVAGSIEITLITA